MGYHDLANKLEAAAKQYLEAETTLTQRGQAAVHAGVDSDDLALPRVVVEAQDGDEFPLDSGNYTLGLSVSVMSSADGTAPLDDHRARSANVFDAFANGTLAVDLTANGTDFHAFGVHSRRYGRTERDDRHWTSQFSCEVYCCPQTIT